MVPSDFQTFFVTSATVSGALVGLLFVAVSVSPERMAARSAPATSEGLAASALTAFTNTMFLSLAALIPGANLGIVAIVVAALGLLSTGTLAALPWKRREARSMSSWWLYLSVGIGLLYTAEMVYGIVLLRDSHERSAVSVLAGVTLGLFAVGLARAWQLLGGRGHRVVDALWFWTRESPDDPRAEHSGPSS